MEKELSLRLEQCRVVEKAWTRTELESPPPYSQPYQDRYVRSYFPGRSPDVLLQLKRYYTDQVGVAATHGSPYPYDTHVPVLLVHPGLDPAVLSEPFNAVDLAPTLAGLLGITAPDELDGRDRCDWLLSQAPRARAK